MATPARVAFVIGLDRYFPPAFGKVHPRWQTPYVAILVQAVLDAVDLTPEQDAQFWEYVQRAAQFLVNAEG